MPPGDHVSKRLSTSRVPSPLAGFQTSINGRIWVSTEGIANGSAVLLDLGGEIEKRDEDANPTQEVTDVSECLKHAMPSNSLIARTTLSQIPANRSDFVPLTRWSF